MEGERMERKEESRWIVVCLQIRDFYYHYRCRVHFIMMNTVSPNKNKIFHTNIEIRCTGRYICM